VNKEKNAAREQAIQIKTRAAKNANKLARTKERQLFRKKQKRQVDEETERHRRIQDSCKFYKRKNEVIRPFKPQVVMCRAKNWELLTNKNQELAIWKEHFEEKTTLPLPNREGMLKYLKNNKAAGADFIAAKL
jgi:hypothetical protein